MNYSDYRFTLDIANTHQAQVSVPATYGDSARRLYIGLTEGRKPYTITNGCRAVFAAKKPDGKKILNDCIIEANKTIVYEFNQNTASAEGVVDCEIRLYGTDGKLITSPQFIIVVDKRVVRDEEIMLSENEYTAIDNMLIAETIRAGAEAERVAAEEERVATYEKIKKVYGKSGSVTLFASGWSGKEQSIVIPDLGENDLIMFYPASSADNNALSIYNVYCETEAIEGEVVFTCAEKPSDDISLRYHINMGRGDE